MGYNEDTVSFFVENVNKETPFSNPNSKLYNRLDILLSILFVKSPNMGLVFTSWRYDPLFAIGLRRV